MNILYVSQYFPPEVCAPAIRVNEFTQEWAKAGHSVRVLTGFPNHPEGVLHPDYRKRWMRGFAQENHGGVKVSRTWLLPARNRGLWGRAANYLSFAASASLTGPLVAERRSAVIGTSPQLLVGAAGYAIARSRGLPFVFEVRDLWPQSIVAVGAASGRSSFYRGLERLANYLYRHADKIVLDGEAKRSQLVDMGIPVEKTVVIRNGVSTDFCLDPQSSSVQEAQEETRKRLGLENKFVVMYIGTLGMAHGLETVLLAAERLRNRQDISFVILGDGAERETLLRKSQELRLSNVLFLGKQPREAIPGYLAAADACLAPLRKREVFKTAIPSKMFEAMAAGKPVLLGVEGEAKDILLDAQGGIPVPPEDPGALAEAVLQLRASPALCNEMGVSGRHAVLSKYSRHGQAAAYLSLLDELTHGTRGRAQVALPWTAETAPEKPSNALTSRGS